jgi:hypothetical protein
MLYTLACPPPHGPPLLAVEVKGESNLLNTCRKIKTKPKNYGKTQKIKGGPGKMKRILVLKNFFYF